MNAGMKQDPVYHQIHLLTTFHQSYELDWSRYCEIQESVKIGQDEQDQYHLHLYHSFLGQSHTLDLGLGLPSAK